MADSGEKPKNIFKKYLIDFPKRGVMWLAGNWRTIFMFVGLGFLIYFFIALKSFFDIATVDLPDISDFLGGGGGDPIPGTGTPRYEIPDYLKTTLPPTPIPTDSPTPVPTPAPTEAPTFPPLKEFISFIGNDNQSIVKYDFINKDIGWEFDVGLIILTYSLSTDDGTILVGCMDIDGSGGSVKYISMTDFGGSLIHNFTGHTGSVGATAIKNGKGLTGSDGGECKYWDLAMGNELSTFVLGEPIVDIDFIGDYAVLCSGNEIFLWKIKGENGSLANPILERTYPVSEKYGIPKFVKAFTDYKFAVGTDDNIVVYSITQTEELGSFSKTHIDTLSGQGYEGYNFLGDLIGFAINPINAEAASFYESGKVILVNLLNYGFLMATNESKNQLIMKNDTKGLITSTATKKGIDYSADGVFLTGGGCVWKRSNGSLVEYTCPGCESSNECSCAGLGCVCGLSREPRFFNA